jgi:hypothetical protein
MRHVALLIVAINNAVMVSYVDAGTPISEVRSSLDHLHRWLDTGPGGPAWRDYLQTEKLLGELAKGDRADVLVVAEICGLHASCKEAVDSRPFIRVREALENWLCELPPPDVDQLPAACRVAKSMFVARGPNDLAEAKARLLSAVDRLDARLRAAGEGAQAWREFLQWDAMQAQLASAAGPDLRVLDAVYAEYVSGYEGLGLIWFGDVRQALKEFLYTARAIQNPPPREQFEALLDILAERLEAYRESPSADNALVIGQALERLHDAGQVAWLIRAVRHHSARPNLAVHVSEKLIAAGMGRQVDDVEPVRDCILGTDLHATGHTVGKVDIQLGDSPDHALIYAVMRGTTETEGIGYNGPVRIYNVGSAEISSRKAIMADAERVWTSPAEAQALLATTVTGIQSRRDNAMVEKFAWKRAMKQKPQADCIATQHAEERIGRRVDAEADPLVEKLDRAYQTKFRKPMSERKLFPQQLDIGSTEAALEVRALEAGPFDLGAPGEPPLLAGEPDLAIRVHESSINNLAGQGLGGMILQEERVRAALAESLPERFQAEQGGESWGITFAGVSPIAVTFDDNRFSVTVRGRKYTKEGKDYPGMNVSVTYKIEGTGDQVRAVRQGPPEIFPPGFVPGRDTLSARQQVLRTMIEGRLEKVFEEVLFPKPIALAGEWADAGQLVLSEWKAADGWLVMGWRLSP